jgi:hypothetical protein
VVEHVVGEIDGRLRLLPGYERRLRAPTLDSLGYIDALVEKVPGATLCCRSAFNEDPRVNAFFVNPRHIQEVFSDSAEVRELFERNSDAEECWALLCVRREERRQLGMELSGDAVQREVMQTVVSFTDHQVISPGCSEEDARRSLKCCIFSGLLGFIRGRASAAKTAVEELENRLKALRGREKRGMAGGGQEASGAGLRSQIERLERDLAQQDARMASLEGRLEFVADVLANPSQYLSCRSSAIRLSRLGTKLNPGAPEAGLDVPLSEIRIASREPRVGMLARFPRSELLPRKDFLTQADLFLSLL